MSGIEDTLNSLFPFDWLDPYGNMPMNKSYDVQIDITQVETENGLKVTAVKKPPRAATTSIEDVIKLALGCSCENESDNKEKEDKNDKAGNDFNSVRADSSSKPGEDRQTDPAPKK